jgi:hypothetical protein
MGYSPSYQVGMDGHDMIGLHRFPGRYGMHLIVDGQRWKDPTTGRQDKAGCPAGGAMRLSDCLHVVS